MKIVANIHEAAKAIIAMRTMPVASSDYVEIRVIGRIHVYLNSIPNAVHKLYAEIVGLAPGMSELKISDGSNIGEADVVVRYDAYVEPRGETARSLRTICLSDPIVPVYSGPYRYRVYTPNAIVHKRPYNNWFGQTSSAREYKSAMDSKALPIDYEQRTCSYCHLLINGPFGTTIVGTYCAGCIEFGEFAHDAPRPSKYKGRTVLNLDIYMNYLGLDDAQKRAYRIIAGPLGDLQAGKYSIIGDTVVVRTNSSGFITPRLRREVTNALRRLRSPTPSVLYIST